MFPRDRIKFGGGCVCGFLAGFGVPALAGAAIMALLFAIHEAPHTGEIIGAILGQIAGVIVTAGIGALIVWLWSKVDPYSDFGAGCVKGAFWGVMAVCSLGFAAIFFGWFD